MKKALKFMTCALLGGSMLFAAACGGKDPGTNPGDKGLSETRPLALSISKPDGNFNPFFYTAQPDGQVIAQTQASLLTADYNEKSNKIYPVAGEDYPTVAKDFRITYYDARSGGNKSGSEAAADGGRTEYEFLIKKGMKYSDGTDLTIKDVLFNFYVYLDTAYTGSNTMYSVDIQGLAAYQENNALLGIDGEGNNDVYILAAQGRMGHLINFGAGREELTEQGKADLAKVKQFYDEELQSDWNSITGSNWKENFEVNYRFTESWQAFLFQEGLVEAQRADRPGQGSYEIRVNYNADGTYTKIDPDNKEAYNKGKILTTLDKWDEAAIGRGSTEVAGADDYIEAIAALTSDKAIEEYCITLVKSMYFMLDRQVGDILSYWATGSTAYTYFLADERGKAIEENAGSDKARNYISGIQTYKTTSFSSSIDGKSTAEYQLDGDYDVLKIIINNVDPAAIWQFGISIAPMHYYSGSFEGKNYVTSFTGDQNNGQGSGVDCFGVKRGSVEFFEKVISGQDTTKSAIPVGAGPYMASTRDGGRANSSEQFFGSDNMVYYERNPYFETMGTGLNNTKIKYMRYKVVEDDRIIPSVLDGSIDYGEPTGSTTNQATVTANLNKLEQYKYDTNGYGYVGINPTYVPDIEVRRLIMSAMQIDLATDFYGELAQPIFRPMSKTSWAYPNDAVTYYPQKSSAQIEARLRELGYTKNGEGVYEKDGNALKYTFTIAGANTDHPAYLMFQEAAKTLNQAGFSISVANDSTALAKLAKGQLTVWAAAWSSGVDPDMYQVYHKDSNATSVLNWGYKTILADTTPKYEQERSLINKISSLIEDGRTYLEDEARIGIYATALNEIMNLAVELPVYQRKDLCIVNKTIIDVTTLNQKPNATMGVIDRIWLIDYVK